MASEGIGVHHRKNGEGGKYKYMIIATVIEYLAYVSNSLATLFNILHKGDNEELNRKNRFRRIEK